MMKNNKKIVAVIITTLTLAGCTMTKQQEHTVVGTGLGAAAGAGIAAVTGGNAGIGAAVGAGVGAVGGALMDH